MKAKRHRLHGVRSSDIVLPRELYDAMDAVCRSAKRVATGIPVCLSRGFPPVPRFERSIIRLKKLQRQNGEVSRAETRGQKERTDER